MRTLALEGLAQLYRIITTLRNEMYDQGMLRAYRSSLPVVCVGNLTAGGTGKTPLVRYIVSELQERGLRPVILSRGYGGKARGPLLVGVDSDPALAGDEPLMLARRPGVPVVVAKARADGARFIEACGLGDVIVLDDGLQHRALARDVNVVSIFAGGEETIRAFREGRLLPRGRFREDRDSALARTDLVVLSERRILEDGEQLPPIDARILDLLPPRVTVFRSTLEPEGVRMLSGDSLLPRGPVVVCAGIGNPESFFASVRALGYDVKAEYPFPDHHHFTEQDVALMLDEYPEAALVCTEKDAVKLERMKSNLLLRCAVLAVRLKMTPRDTFAVTLVKMMQGQPVPT